MRGAERGQPYLDRERRNTVGGDGCKETSAWEKECTIPKNDFTAQKLPVVFRSRGQETEGEKHRQFAKNRAVRGERIPLTIWLNAGLTQTS